PRPGPRRTPSAAVPRCPPQPSPSARFCHGRANMCGMAYDSPMAGDEQPVLLQHPHWKTLIPPLLLAVVVVAAALVAEVVIPSGSAAAAERLAGAAIAILALMLWLMVPGLRWRATASELTTRRP